MVQYPLEKITVVEFANVLAAPLVGSFLGDFGANVIKVERPIIGDTSRVYGSKPGSRNLGFIITNRNKAVLSTGDRFVTKKLEDCHLVDMEAYAIAKVCEINDVDFKCYKYVTDYVGSNSTEIWEENIEESHPSFVKVIYDHFQNSV